MKIRSLALSLALLAPAAQAQYAYEYAPLTGDPALDAVLETINVLFNDEPDYYVEQIVYETQAPPVYVREYITERRYAPADVYMIGELSQVSGKSFGDVATVFDANRGQGWGAVARSLGIKPGSAQFHQLKNGTTGFVERGKGRKAKHGNAGGNAVRVANSPNPGKPGKAKGNGKDKGNGKGKDK